MEDEGFSTSEEFERTPYFEQSGNRNYESDGSEQSGSKVLPEFDMQEQGIMDSSENSSPLGLTLRKTPSFVDLVHKTLAKGKQKVPSQTKKNYGEKAKASNFPAKLLRIGTWQRMTTYEGDLVAKIYYAKRKIVWEILQRPLKCKIETQWSDIIGIRAIMPPNGEGTLEIELDQPPLFYRETNPQPRKHTLWQQSSDFTGGQASIWRRHYVQFAPGILDKHFPMLLQCDERMFALSHQPFPRQESPFFNSNIFGCSESTFNIYGHGSRFLPGMQYPCQAYPTTIRTTPLVHPPNTSVKDFHSTMSNYQFLPQNQTGWGQGGSFPTEENIQVAAPINYVGDSGIPNPNARVLFNIENHLLQDSQIVCCDETNLNSKVESTYSLLDPLEVNSSNTFAPIDANPNTQVMQNGIENSMSDGFYPQCISWISQYSNENVMMQPGVNNLVYPFVLAGSTNGNFSSSNSNPDIKKWT